jgi:hypothetical protein
MSEYLFVEKPFLDHLVALGWEVIDQGTHSGAHAIPRCIVPCRAR